MASGEALSKVAMLDTLESGETPPASSMTFMAKWYMVSGASPVTVKVSAEPAICGVGSPAACVAFPKSASFVIALVL